MENINVTINRETRMVNLSKVTLGNDGENLQENLVFSFSDEFVDGTGRLEMTMPDDTSSYVMLSKINSTYQIPVMSIMTQEGKISMQLVITEGTNEEDIPVFKSNVFSLKVRKSINAEIEEPESYAQWIDIANAKLNEIDEAISDLEDKVDSGYFKGDKGDPGQNGINGRDATINGVNTLNITAGDNITLTQSESTLEISATDGGTSDYSDLTNKPQINSVMLSGNKSLNDLGIQATIANNNKLSSDLVDDTNAANKFFSGNYNDLTNKPTIPIVPTNVSTFTNDAGYLTSHQDISGKEDKSNKVTTIDNTSTDLQYASAKAIYDLVSASGGSNINVGIINNAGQQNNTNTFIIESLKKGLYIFKDTENYYNSLYYKWKENYFSFTDISLQMRSSVKLFLVIEKDLDEIIDENVFEKIGYLIVARKGGSGEANYEGRYQFFEFHVKKSTEEVSIVFANNESPKIYFVTENNQYWYGLKYFDTIPQQSNTTAPTLDTQFTNKKYVDDSIASAITTTLNGSY